MKNKILMVVLLIFGLAFAQKPTTRTPESTDYVNLLDSNGESWDQTLTQILGASLDATFGDVTLTDVTLDTLTVNYINDVITDSVTAARIISTGEISGTKITGTAKLDIDQAVNGGSAVGNIIKLTQAAGETYTSTTAGLTVKNYDADGTVVHGSDENTGLAVFMKQQSASLVGGENSIMSLHSHSSAIGKLDHGIIMYPDTVGSAIAVRAAVIDYGLDFNDRDNVTVNTAEIRGANGETIDNTTDGIWDIGAAKLEIDSAQLIIFGATDTLCAVVGSDTLRIFPTR